MQDKITIDLSPDLRDALDEAVREEGVPPTELVAKAISDFLYIRRFRALRDRLSVRAEQLGIRSEEDIFDQVS